ncbi:hypothetical protein [Hahella ganghwensis]|uniref:hypothetical protein n=1 Tax=Hahella ganghwensis TaxID=286420 RepID=UPI00036365A5|nr:hypothetical protein [Hahella ganghwensis]
MNVDQAREELSFHSGRNGNTDDQRWEHGFLGSLRPYKGMDAVEKNFHKVIECLRVLAPTLNNCEAIDRSLVSDISGILCLGKAWAVHEDGMLRSNKLVSGLEAMTIDAWLDCISYAWMMLLDTQDELLAFEFYNEQFKK